MSESIQDPRTEFRYALAALCETVAEGAQRGGESPAAWAMTLGAWWPHDGERCDWLPLQRVLEAAAALREVPRDTLYGYGTEDFSRIAEDIANLSRRRSGSTEFERVNSAVYEALCHARAAALREVPRAPTDARFASGLRGKIEEAAFFGGDVTAVADAVLRIPEIAALREVPRAPTEPVQRTSIADTVGIYGCCPGCYCLGTSRKDGWDICSNGHVYVSQSAITDPSNPDLIRMHALYRGAPPQPVEPPIVVELRESAKWLRDVNKPITAELLERAAKMLYRGAPPETLRAPDCWVERDDIRDARASLNLHGNGLVRLRTTEPWTGGESVWIGRGPELRASGVGEVGE